MNEIVTVKMASTISAAHYLQTKDCCSVMHGHNWKVYVTVRGALNNGMVINVLAIKDYLRSFDHTNLNHVVHNPTMEILAVKFTTDILTMGENIKYVEVIVSETDDCFATYSLRRNPSRKKNK